MNAQLLRIKFIKVYLKSTILIKFLGHPLIQIKLNKLPIDLISFAIIENNPGWMAIESYSGNVFVGDISRYFIEFRI